MDLNEAVKLLRSLNNNASIFRDAFEDFEEKGKIKIDLENVTAYKKIPKERKQEV